MVAELALRFGCEASLLRDRRLPYALTGPEIRGLAAGVRRARSRFGPSHLMAILAVTDPRPDTV